MRLTYFVLAFGSLAACAQQGGDDGGDFSTPGTVVVSRGNNQVAAAGEPFAEPLVAVVFTPGGNKCNGCEVGWDLAPGGFSSGEVFGSTALTGESALNITGIAVPGTYAVTATIDDGSSATFTLTVQ